MRVQEVRNREDNNRSLVDWDSDRGLYRPVSVSSYHFSIDCY